MLLYVLTIFFAMLWSAGNLSLVEYFLWLSLGLVFVYGVYISGKTDKERNFKKDSIIFIYGFSILSLTVLLNLMEIIKTGWVILLIITIPFSIVFKARGLNG